MNELSILTQALRQSRRTFLLRTASTVAFPLSLAACGGGDYENTTTSPPTSDGGGGGGTVTLTKTSAKGTIVMPAGATVHIASVTNAFGSSVPAANGTFDFVSVAESTMFAIGTGPAGGAVLYGLLQDGAAELSPHSTAVVLAYNFLGVGVYVGDMQRAYLDAIAASSSVVVLQEAIAAAIVTRGEDWLQTSDTALVAAISGVQQALSVTALTGAQPASGREAGAMADRAHPLGIVQDKTDRVSGLQVVNDGVGAFKITNYYRRRSYAYVDRVSYKTTYQGAAIDSPATVGTQPLKIEPTKAITNSLVTIAQYFAGSTDFYEPVVSDSIAIARTPDEAVLTTYTVNAVGLGGFSGDFSLLSSTQHDGLLRVAAETVILDFIVPIFTSILLPARDLHSGGTFAPTTFAEAAEGGLLKDLIDTLAASDDLIISKIIQPVTAGRDPAAVLADVLWDIVLLIAGRDSLKNAILLFFQYVLEQIGGTPGDFINQGAKKILDFTSALDLGLQLMDTAVSGLQIATCDVADRFTLDVSKANVKLNPLNPNIDYPNPVTFTLSVIDSDLAPGTELSYRWSCVCAFGDVSDQQGHVNTSGTPITFDSVSPTLTYTPNTRHGRGGDQDIVVGTVYLGQINQRTSSLGYATSTITYNAAITPSTLQLLVNTQQTFTADMSTALLASGTPLQYVWTVTGGGTVGGASTVTTTTPSVSYMAGGTAGTDTLKLTVTSATGTVITGGSATITVLGAVAAGISPQNPQVPRSTVLNFVVTAAAGSFPSGSTYKWVLTHTPDLFGRPQDIGASGGGTIGVTATPLPKGVSPGMSVTVTTTSPTIAFAANPFGPEAYADTFFWNPSLTLAVSVIGAGGGVLTTSSTTIYTQVPTSILLP